MSAARMANIAEGTRKQLAETVRFMTVQAKIWRSLSIIHAHHPECAKDSMMVMALNGTLVGNLELLEAKEQQLMLQAQYCGRSLGVFADDGKKCDTKGLLHLWTVERKRCEFPAACHHPCLAGCDD